MKLIFLPNGSMIEFFLRGFSHDEKIYEIKSFLPNAWDHIPRRRLAHDE